MIQDETQHAGKYGFILHIPATLLDMKQSQPAFTEGEIIKLLNFALASAMRDEDFDLSRFSEFVRPDKALIEHKKETILSFGGTFLEEGIEQPEEVFRAVLLTFDSHLEMLEKLYPVFGCIRVQMLILI